MTQKLKIKKSDCNMIESLKSNDFVAKNKTVLKSQKQNQELAMLDLEIASLKLELLVQTEIANNNKDAYDKVRGLYDEKCHELLKLKGEHATQYEELSAVEGKLIKAQAHTETLRSLVEHAKKPNIELQLRVTELEKENTLLRELNEKISNKLKSIPNWIRWIFKYVF